jgi:hypothetical protein
MQLAKAGSAVMGFEIEHADAAGGRPVRHGARTSSDSLAGLVSCKDGRLPRLQTVSGICRSPFLMAALMPSARESTKKQSG